MGGFQTRAPGRESGHIKPRQRRLFESQSEVGSLVPEPEQREKLLPVQRDDDQQAHQGEHFEKAVNVLPLIGAGPARARAAEPGF
jgi:hypothetical protein